MNLSNEASIRINLLRLYMIILIVFIHGYIGINHVHINIGFNYFQTILSQVYARIAVPIFFLLSGMLLFKNYELNYFLYFRKLKSKIRSLLIPYLAWNIIVAILFLILQGIPSLKSYSNGNLKPLISYHLSDWAILFAVKPIATQFWFIRDLILLNIIAPLFFFLAKYLKLFSVIPFFILWIINPEYRIFNLNYEAIFFFHIGALLVFYPNWLASQKYKKLYLTMLILFILFAIGDAYLYINKVNYFYQIHKLFLLFGVFPTFYLTINTAFLDKLPKRLNSLFVFTFFIYAFHEPMLTFLKRIMVKFIYPSSDFAYIFIYLTAIILSILISILTAFILRKFAKPIYNILTGNR